MGPREKCVSSKISTRILSNTSRCTAKDSKNSFQFHGFLATTFRVNLIFCIVLQHPVIILLSSCVIAHPLNFTFQYQHQTIFTVSFTATCTSLTPSLSHQSTCNAIIHLSDNLCYHYPIQESRAASINIHNHHP